jgi:hypothetical protein
MEDTEKDKPNTAKSTGKIDPIASGDWFLLKETRYLTSAGKRGKNYVYADRYVYSPSSSELGVIEEDGTLYRFGREGTLIQIQEESGELDEIIEYHLIGYPLDIRVTR